MRISTRSRKLKLNTISSLCLQVLTVVSGFIIPRLMLQYYGSEVNGLVSSISQFLRLIAFMELGVGAVVQSSLYNPIASQDYYKVSQVISSASKFFRLLAVLLVIYVCVIISFFPRLIDNKFSWTFTTVLIIAMSIDSFMQYYFCLVDGLLLSADQKGYIFYNVQTVTIIVNTVASAFLIVSGKSIQVVKIVSALIFVIKPIIIRLYVNREYHIDRKIKYEVEPIKQKWNGICQHISAVVLDFTDVAILTLFSSLLNVSIYSVYYMVVNGVRQLFVALTNGVQALLGDMWAKDEKDKLRDTFMIVDWAIHTGVTLGFTCTGILLVNFVKVYTADITDANYNQPLFAAVITIAQAMFCIRLPYHIMIKACGHYKQTQKNYVIATVVNILISVFAVNRWGLVGVALGTLIAMIYQTVWMAVYNSNNFIKCPIKKFAYQCLADVLTVIISICLTFKLRMVSVSYFAWIILAIKVVLVVLGVVVFVNMLMYRDRMIRLKKKLLFLK